MVRPRILVADTYYPDFLRSLKIPEDAQTYQDMLDYLLKMSFGTSDFYSRNLAAEGWEAFDIVANSLALQKKWCDEKGIEAGNIIDIALEQIRHYEPDVLFCQDLSFLPPEALRSLPVKILAGQCSCPMPPEENVSCFDVLLTSFPHYVDRFNKLGVKGVFSKLAFDTDVLNRVCVPTHRNIPVSFAGGVGTPSHWSYGMHVLESVAREIPESRFWGYGYNLLPSTMQLKQKYMGEAWGIEMYRVLASSKIVINRHGEVAQGFTNNMRCYEATGMGALLMTEESKNLSEIFSDSEVVSYKGPRDLIDKIRYYLDHEEERAEIASRGQTRTLSEHTYRDRMKIVSQTLLEMLG